MYLIRKSISHLKLETTNVGLVLRIKFMINNLL